MWSLSSTVEEGGSKERRKWPTFLFFFSREKKGVREGLSPNRKTLANKSQFAVKKVHFDQERETQSSLYLTTFFASKSVTDPSGPPPNSQLGRKQKKGGEEKDFVCVTSKEKKEIRRQPTVGEEKAESQKILWVFLDRSTRDCVLSNADSRRSENATTHNCKKTVWFSISCPGCTMPCYISSKLAQIFKGPDNRFKK